MIEQRYPFNMAEFLGVAGDDVFRISKAGVERALQELSPCEREIVIKRYREGKTLKSIAAECGLSATRIGQLHSKAAIRMRALGRIHKWLLPTIEKYLSLLEKCKRLERENYGLQQRYVALEEAYYDACAKAGIPPVRADVLDTPLNETGLSARALNALSRAGLETLRDIHAKSDSELLKIRNLGKKSVKEVRQMLKGYLAV